MNFRSPKEQDSLSLLQRDLNQLGLAKYLKAKKAKETKLKKQKQKQNKNLSMQNSMVKFPPINGEIGLNNQVGRILEDNKNLALIQKIKQFENKVSDLQTENAIQKKQNQKLVDYVAKLRNNHKSLYERSSYSSKNNMQPFYPQIPQFCPYIMPQMPFNFGMPGMPNMMNPYQQYPQNGFQNPRAQGKYGKQYKKKIKLTAISKFRVYGYVVHFSIFFKKYSKSFTLNRFDIFKDKWKKGSNLKNAQKNLKQYISKNISLNIFQRKQINQLDSLKNINLEDNKTKQKIPTKEQSVSDSQDSSDLQSQSQTSLVKKQKVDKKGENPNVFQFYLKIDVAVSFVVQLTKQINKVIIKDNFLKQNPFIQLFLDRQFQPDELHQETDLNYLNLHHEKGYSQIYNKAVIQYFLIKNIYLDIFVNKSLLNELANKFFLDGKRDTIITQQNRVFFSFFIRTSIFKIMVEKYLKKKIQKSQSFPLPSQELTPFYKRTIFEDPLHNQAVSFQNNGNNMKQQNIEQISSQQRNRKQKQLKQVLDDSCAELIKKLMQLRKLNYKQIKQSTLGKKYRTQGNDYFKLHSSSEMELNYNIKTTNSFQTSMANSRLTASRNIAIVKKSTNRHAQPSGKQIAPSGKQIAPSSRQIAPSRKQIAPSGKQMNPRSRQQNEETNRQIEESSYRSSVKSDKISIQNHLKNNKKQKTAAPNKKVKKITETSQDDSSEG